MIIISQVTIGVLLFIYLSSRLMSGFAGRKEKKKKTNKGELE